MMLLPVILFFIVSFDKVVTSSVNLDAVQALSRRVLGAEVADFARFEPLSPVSGSSQEAFEYEGSALSKVVFRGTSTSALTSALGWYLRNDARVQVSWSGKQMDAVSSSLPLPSSKVNIERVVKYSYYSNVCTLSYTMVWWDWERWEQELDWMALSGINTFLAFVGQESIWEKLFLEFGLKRSDLDDFFTGPAFLAWQRMGNIKKWAGPLPQHWIIEQNKLQKKILARARELGMKPILPAFAGHVPDALKSLYPDANISDSNPWGGFDSQITPVAMLQPTDPLFVKLGSRFVELMIEEFGTDHLYNADTFNEMRPVSAEFSYLQAASQAMATSLTSADSKAVWIMQGWLFQDKAFWTYDRRQAYLSGVEKGRMIVLDLYSEVSPIYTESGGYFNHDWVWNMLHNFGGNFGLYGRMQVLQEEPIRAREASNGTMVGIGLTPEGIEQNFIVYEFMNEMAFRSSVPNTEEWVTKFVARRYGIRAGRNSAPETAWKILWKTVYISASMQFGVTKSLYTLRPTLTTRRSSFMPTELFYDPNELWKALGHMMSVSNELESVETFRYDLVDLWRQVLSDRFLQMHAAYLVAYTKRNVEELATIGAELLAILDDLDMILSTNEHFLLGRWIAAARSKADASEPEMGHAFEFNARNQITLWGPKGEIADYASKAYAGLISTYYKPRWLLFTEQVLAAVSNSTSFGAEQVARFNADCLRLEQQWQTTPLSFATEPTADTVLLSNVLYHKYGSASPEQQLQLS